MTGRELIYSYSQLNPERYFHGPFPDFIFRDEQRRIMGEFAPLLEAHAWSGEAEESLVLDRPVKSWYITWDIQDIDVVQFWITVENL